MSKTDVLKALNDAAGTKDAFEVREVEVESGKVTQIISANGSLVAQINATNDDAWKKLEGFTTGVVDAGEPPVASVEDGKKFFTKEGVIAFPTQPEALAESTGEGEVNPKEDRAQAAKASKKGE